MPLDVTSGKGLTQKVQLDACKVKECLNDGTTASTEKGGKKTKRRLHKTQEHSVQKMRPRGKQKRRHQRLWVDSVGGGSTASQDPERVDVLEVVFAFSI